MNVTIWSPAAGHTCYLDRHTRQKLFGAKPHFFHLLNQMSPELTEAQIREMPIHSVAFCLGKEELYAVVKFTDGRHCHYPLSLIEKFITIFSNPEEIIRGLTLFVETFSVRSEIQLLNSGVAHDPDLSGMMKIRSYGSERGNLLFTGIVQSIREVEENFFATGSLNPYLLNLAINKVSSELRKLTNQLQEGDRTPPDTNSRLSDIVPAMQRILTRLSYLQKKPADVDAFELKLIAQNSPFFVNYEYALKNPERYEIVRQKIVAAHLQEEANAVALQLISEGQWEEGNQKADKLKLEEEGKKELSEIKEKIAKKQPLTAYQEEVFADVLEYIRRLELLDEVAKAAKMQSLTATQKELIVLALEYKRQQQELEAQIIKQKAPMNYAEKPENADVEEVQAEAVAEDDDGCYHIEIPEGCSESLQEQLEWMNKMVTKRNRFSMAAVQALEATDEYEELCSELNMTIPDCPVLLGGHLFDLEELLDLLRKGKDGVAVRPYHGGGNFTIKNISPAIPTQKRIGDLIAAFNRTVEEDKAKAAPVVSVAPASVISNSHFKPAPMKDAAPKLQGEDVPTLMLLDK